MRRRCLELLRNQPEHNRVYNNHSLNKKLLAEIGSSGAKEILFFYPLESEPDVRSSIMTLRRTRKLYLPFMEGVSFKMVPFRLPLKRNTFGIYEAGNTLRNIKKIDLAIVPAVGVDAQARRIGFGKGMYDRFFAGLKKRPKIIFVQSKHCYTDKRICDGYDISADLLLTPHAVFGRARIKNVKRNALGRRCRYDQRGNRLFYL